VPVISDRWPGLTDLFAEGEEILIADSTEAVVRFLVDVPEAERRAIGERARRRVLAEHTALRRAEQLEDEVAAVLRAPRGAAA
jgi:spore maturation protein CgeB